MSSAVNGPFNMGNGPSAFFLLQIMLQFKELVEQILKVGLLEVAAITHDHLQVSFKEL